MKWDKMDSYNVVYTVPGQTDRSAMPLGNGELCASVWVSEDGVLRFYLARTDALTENDLTAKLGMVRLSTTPDFLSKGGFRQVLLLEDGKIEVKSALGTFRLFIPPQTHTMYITGEFHEKVQVEASYHTWRKKENPQARSPWLEPVTLSADTVEFQDSILFYHKNGKNGIKELAAFQGVRDTACVPDFLTGRIFGGMLELENGRLEQDRLTVQGKECLVKITTCSGQYDGEKEFLEELRQLCKNNPDRKSAEQRAKQYWNQLWQDSYIFVSGDEPAPVTCTLDVIRRAGETMECNDAPSQITRAYLLTRYMIACCKDGNFPILYNGFLFNLTPGNQERLAVETFAGTYTSQPQPEPDEQFNPDDRSWAIDQLWQNLRLPYYTMLATGDFESLKKMFTYYLRFQKVNEQRAVSFYGAKGQHSAEMTLTCGVQSSQIYGTDRTGKHPGQSQNQWGGSIEISPALELLNLMIDYCIYSGDQDFFSDEVLHFAHGIFDYIATRFTKRDEGKIRIEDINCVETYFHTVNPIPIVAGMHCTLQKLLNQQLPEEERIYFEKHLMQTPEIPVGEKNNRPVLLPAEEYVEERWNIELPELYAVYPFGLYTKGKGNEKMAVDTFRIVTEENQMMQPHVIGMKPGTRGYSGWHYIGMSAAMLGMTEEAKEILRYNSALQNPGNRFPAMWGAVHDAVPDSDHGANIMNLLQMMVLQSEGEQISVLPAFPKEWSVKFRLHAPDKKIVECEYEDGEIKYLKIL